MATCSGTLASTVLRAVVGGFVGFFVWAATEENQLG
jgi:hypothetical protein